MEKAERFLVAIVDNRPLRSSTITKDEKRGKMGLTKREQSAKIAKLSQRDGARSAESRPGEGRELARSRAGAKAGTKKDLRKSKKVLDKAELM